MLKLGVTAVHKFVVTNIIIAFYIKQLLEKLLF
jgi:hypothetical protein